MRGNSMCFICSRWEQICRTLAAEGRHSRTAASLLQEPPPGAFLVLKHDVETAPRKALRLARIEQKYGHVGSYYVQAYLLEKPANVAVLRQIQALGHEVSYHYDVLDAAGGDRAKALELYETNRCRFEKTGFFLRTVCQHGNPVTERRGYTSNRDFFRNPAVCAAYPDTVDIMVNYRARLGAEYAYVSDAGYGWKIIADPENNDRDPAGAPDILLGGMDGLLSFVRQGGSVIISTHPHRWQANRISAVARRVLFTAVRRIARTAEKIPVCKKLMSRYYYLAKKI